MRTDSVQGVKLAFAGDIGLIGRVGVAVKSMGVKAGVRGMPREWWEADVRIVNLEIPFVGPGSAPMGVDHPAGLRSDPSLASFLAELKVDIAGLANNHSYDFGETGLRSTVIALEAQGIQWMGAGFTEQEARAPVHVHRTGKAWGFFSRTLSASHVAKAQSWGPAVLQEDELVREVGELKDRGVNVGLSVHWGYNYSPVPEPRQQKLGRRLIEAGCSLVVGHHPHVWQGMETFKGGLIAYSIGDFLFDPACGHIVEGSRLAERSLTGILIAEFQGDALACVKPVPVWTGPELWLAQEPDSPEKETFAARCKTRDSFVQSRDVTKNEFERNAAPSAVRHELRVLLGLTRRIQLGELLAYVGRLRWRHLRMGAASFMGLLATRRNKR